MITARMSCLRSLCVVAGASKTARMSAPARVSQSVPRWCGLGWRARSAASASSAGLPRPGCPPGCLQGPGDQPVIRLDVVVLAARAVRFEAGPLGGQLEPRPADRGAASASAIAWTVAASAAGSSTGNSWPSTACSICRPPMLWQRPGGRQWVPAAAQVAGRACRCPDIRPASSGRSGRSGRCPAAAPRLPGRRRRRPRGAAAVGRSRARLACQSSQADVSGVVAGDQHLPLLRGRPRPLPSPVPGASRPCGCGRTRTRPRSRVVRTQMTAP